MISPVNQVDWRRFLRWERMEEKAATKVRSAMAIAASWIFEEVRPRLEASELDLE